MAGLWVTSPSSRASASAARAAASRPAGAVDEGAAEGEPAGQPGQRAALAGPVDPVAWSAAPLPRRRADRPPRWRPVRGVAGRRRGPGRPRGRPGSRAAHRRHGRCVPAGHPRRAAPEQQVGSRVRRVPGGWQVARRPRDLVQEGGAGGPPGEHGRLQGGQQGVPRGAGVERPQSSCRSRPGRRRPRPRARGGTGSCPRSRVACAADSGSPQAAGGLDQQGVGSVDRPREHVGLRRRQLPLGPPLLARASAAPRVPAARPWRRSHRGSRPGRRPPPARPRPFVGPGGGRGQVPGPGNGVEPGIARRREGPVGLPPLDRRSRRGRPPSGRAGGRTAPAARRPPARRPPPAPRRTPGCPARRPPATADRPGPAGSAAASNSSVCVSAGSSRTRRTNRILEPVTDGQRLGQRRPPAQLLRGQLAGGLDDGERIAPGLGDDALRHVARRSAG